MAVREPREEKKYGLMGVVADLTPKVERAGDADEEVHTWPNLFFVELLGLLSLLAGLMLLALLFDAPLEGIADPSVTPGVAKAPWYFAGLQELLSYFHPFVAGILVPGLAVAALVLLPFADTNPSRRYRERRLAIAVFTLCVVAAVVLTVIGTFFRGAGWSWVWPWQ